MARGLLTGAGSIALLATISLVFTGLFPLYLVKRVELLGKFCWVGEGIWETGKKLGDDIPEIHYQCSGQSVQTSEAYCDVDSPTDYQNSMCTVTNNVKMVIIIGSVFGILSTVLTIVASFVPCRLKAKFWVTNFAALSSLVGVVCSILVVSFMGTSPLMGLGHYKDLSKGLLAPFNAFSCVNAMVDVNFHKKSIALPMSCLFPGPSFASIVVAAVGYAMAFVLLCLKAREFAIQRKVSSSSHSVQPSNDLLAHLLMSPGSGAHTPGLPTHFLYERHYSLYGAVMRRFHNRSFLVRHMITISVPLLNLIGVLFLAATCMIGVSYGLFITLDVVKHHKSHDEDIEKAKLLAKALSLVLSNEPNGTYDLHQTLSQQKSWQVVVQATEYAPITTLAMFVRAGAFVNGITILVSSFIWPSIKTMLWLWFWYAPADEVVRGRVFTWIDALGKISLPNLYVIIVISLCNHWYANIYIPGWLIPLVVPPWKTLRIRVDFALASSAGTITCTLAYTFSLILGEVLVAVHRKCKEWEEKWREEEDLSWRSGASPGDSTSMFSGSTEQSRLMNVDGSESIGEDFDAFTLQNTAENIRVEDTPYFMMYRSHRKYQRVSLRRSPRSPTNGITGSSRVNSANSQSSNTFSDCVAEQLQFYDEVESEALCDRMVSPIEGQHHRYTTFGKVIVIGFILFTAMVLIGAMTTKALQFERLGAVGVFIVDEQYKSEDVSMLMMGSKLNQNSRALTEQKDEAVPSFVVAFFLFTVVMPFVHIVGLALLWLVPMRFSLQKHMMHVIEIIGAWSTLDVFTLVLIGLSIEADKIIESLLDASGVGNTANAIVHAIFPKIGVFYKIKLHLNPQFGFLIMAVICEKLLQQFVVLQFATMLSERAGLQELRRENLIRQQLGRRDRARTQQHAGSPYHQLSTRMVENHMNFLSPAARFYTASGSKRFYAGMFITVWRFLDSCEIIEPVEHIQYHSPPFAVSPRLEDVDEGSEDEIDEDFSLDAEE